MLTRRSPRDRWRWRLSLVLAVSLVLTLADWTARTPRPAAAAQPAEAKLACPASRADRTAALVSARLCGDRVLVDGLTTETTQVWAYPDGHMQAQQYNGVVRLPNDKGGWSEVDLTLHKRADGSVAPGLHPGGLVLAGAAGAGEHDLAVLGAGDEQLAVGWRGALPEPVLAGDKATYVDVRPGVDLVVQSTRYGFETFLVVKSRAGAAQVKHLELPWRTGKLTVSRGDKGDFELKDATGKVKGRVGQAYMWDARVDERSGEPAKRVPFGLSLKEKGQGGSDLVLDPDAGFLDDPTTVYPVVIDPTWDVDTVGGYHDTWVQSDGSTGWNSTELKLGTFDGGSTKARSFLFFDAAPYFGTLVNSATLHLYETWAYSCRASWWESWITGYEDHTATWSNSAGNWWQYIDHSNQTVGYDSCSSDGWVTINVKDQFALAAAQSYAYYNIGLKATDETDSDSWKRFRSSDASSGEPYVTIDFSYPPTVASPVTVPATTSCTTAAPLPWMTSATPRLSATISEYDGQVSSAEFEFGEVGQSTAVHTVTGVYSGTVASWDVPASTPLQQGHSYQWRVRATDSSAQSSAWSSPCAFTVDSVAPHVPWVTSSTYPENGNSSAASGAFTFTAAAGDTDVAAYSYQLDTDTAAITATATSGAATVTLTPSTDGHRSLTVRAKDTAGNLSAPYTYAFTIGRGSISQPTAGAEAITQVKIVLDVVDTSLTQVRYQYRRGPGATEADVPLANLRKADGSTPSAYPLAISALGGYAVWNIADTVGTLGGVVQVRAVLTPASGTAYNTEWVTVNVDPDGDDAATTQVGPGSVNLQTGDYTISSTDVDDMGLSVSRVASSREPTDGWLPQGERLSANQQQVSTDISGFVTDTGANIVRTTSRGQGGTTDSLQITAPSSGESYAAVGCQYSLCVGMLPGHRYRMTGWVYVPAATGLTGGVNPSRTSRIVAHYYDGGSYHEVPSPAPTYTDAWQQLTLDVTVPASATQMFFRIYNDQSSGKVVYWDNLSLRELVAPFGPSWRGGVADAAAGSEFTALEFPEPNVAVLQTATGGEISFARATGTGAFFPAPGAESLTLAYDPGNDRYQLTDVGGTIVLFGKPTTGATRYVVTSTRTPDDPSTTTYVYDSTANRVLLSRVVNPVEPGVTGCTVPVGTTPGRGCEVLEYVYATATTANATTPGDVVDQVSAVKVWTWDPVGGAETAVEVAHYRYDTSGRLRDVWDPRVSTTMTTSYEYDADGRVTKATPPGELAWMFDFTSIAGDANAGRVIRIRRANLAAGSSSSVSGELVTRVVYQVPLTRAAGGPYDLGPATVHTWGQTEAPTTATALFGPQDDPGTYLATSTVPGTSGFTYATVHYLDASARETNTAAPHAAGAAENIDSVQYDRFGNTVWTLEATNRLLALSTLPNDTLSALGLAGLDTAGRAQALSTVEVYSADGQDLLSTTGPTMTMVLDRAVADPDGAGPLAALAAATSVVGRPHTANTYDEGKPDGAKYHLVTTSVSGATLQLAGYPDADTRTTVTGYNPDNGSTSGWVLKKPTKIVADAGGTNQTSWIVYDSAGRAVKSWGVGSTGSDAAASQTIYYTAGPNSADALCGNKLEWAGLACVTSKAGPVTGQSGGMTADLPVRRVQEYSRWGDAAVVTETVPGSTASRTTTTTYDGAGRTLTLAITSANDGAAALPTVTTGYSTDNGQVTTVTTVTGGVPSTITRDYDKLGRVWRYTDADGGVTTNEFDQWGRPSKVTDPTGYATFTYDRGTEPRGLVTAITDSVAGTFTAGYSPDGQLIVVGYPGGFTRTDVLDTNLEPYQRTYTRNSDNSPIYSETLTSNSAGQTTIDIDDTGTRTYHYDSLGRLDKAQDALAGTGCTTREYHYDIRSNRDWRRTWNPAGDGTCRDETSTGAPAPDGQVTYTVDSADRLTGTGYTYDAFNRITALPGGLTNAYYANDRVNSQTLGTDRQTWTLDPARRQRAFTTETNTSGTWTTSASKLNHYSDDSDEPRWIVENTSTSVITRNVSGPDGDLAATTTGATTTLQLTNLHGDVVTTIDATLTPTAYTHYDEFGVPAAGQATARYGWLGGKQRSAEALGGVVLMGARLYAPQLGRFLQPDPVDGGSATAYDYCNADPVNCTDLAGTSFWSKVKSVAKVVAPIAEFASIIPGPIGTAAAVVSAAAYAVSGNRAKAIEMTVTAAVAMAGGGAILGAAKLAKVAKTSIAASRAAPRVLWTGDKAGETIAAATAFAKRIKGKTLEMTVVGRTLTTISKVLPRSVTLPLWTAASRSFARGAQGVVHTVYGPGAVGKVFTQERAIVKSLKLPIKPCSWLWC